MASIVEVLIGLSGLVGLLLRFIGPLSIAPTICLIGLSLANVAADFCSKQWWIAIMCVVSAAAFFRRRSNSIYDRRCARVARAILNVLNLNRRYAHASDINRSPWLPVCIRFRIPSAPDRLLLSRDRDSPGASPIAKLSSTSDGLADGNFVRDWRRYDIITL